MSKKVFAIATGIMVGMAAIAGGIYVGVSMTKVDQGEVGVVYTMKEGVQKETLNPGYHWVGPFAKVKDYPVAQQQREDRLNISLGTGNMDNPQSIHIG